jgi:hypothetical protein
MEVELREVSSPSSVSSSDEESDLASYTIGHEKVNLPRALEHVDAT